MKLMSSALLCKCFKYCGQICLLYFNVYFIGTVPKFSYSNEYGTKNQPQRTQSCETACKPLLKSSTTSPPRSLSVSVSVPAPYCPGGISPSKSAYSRGWSSVWIAKLLMPSSVGGTWRCVHGLRIFGIKHDKFTIYVV